MILKRENEEMIYNLFNYKLDKPINNDDIKLIYDYLIIDQIDNINEINDIKIKDINYLCYIIEAFMYNSNYKMFIIYIINIYINNPIFLYQVYETVFLASEALERFKKYFIILCNIYDLNRFNFKINLDEHYFNDKIKCIRAKTLIKNFDKLGKIF